jgi:hypothetical protein
MDGKRPTALILAPFDGAWGAVHKAVVAALEEDGVAVVWLNANAEPDAAAGPRIHDYLDEADVVVADLSEANPNVMYEMGYAHALRKPVLPVIERHRERVPSSLRGRLFFVYDRSNPTELIAFVGRWMERYLAESKVEERVG